MKYTKNGEILFKDLNSKFRIMDALNTFYAIYAVYEKQNNNKDIEVEGVSKEVIEEYSKKYTLADIRSACELFFEFYLQNVVPGMETTPKGIAKLATKILDINSTDSVADFGSCYGDFLIDVNDTANLFGIELIKETCELSSMRSEILGKKIEFINDSVFNAKSNEYNKIFVNCPFGMRAKYIFGNSQKNYEDKLYNNATSGDWLYALAALEALKKNGRAVSIVTTGSLINKPDSTIREHLIKEGRVEAVILLPERLFSTTVIQTAVVVFSENNKEIRFVDASHCFKKERRINVLEQNNVDEIIELLKNDSENCKTVKLSDIDNDSYILDPRKYLIEEYYAENEVVLGDYINVRRAGRYSANELDEYITDEETSYKCLTLANAQDYLVGGDYSNFKEMPPKSDKLIIKDNSIILSRAGSPEFKASLFKEVEGQTMIANGNFYIIDVDEDKLDPYYLLAYLISPLAQKRLEASATGAIIKMLPTEAIKTLRIPMVSLAEQQDVKAEVKDSLCKIRYLKEQLSDAYFEITSLI